MKKIVFTLVALAGLLSASEYLKIDDGVVMISHDNTLTTIFKISDIAYTTREGNKNLVILKQPLGATIQVENNFNQNDIAKKFAEYLSSRR